MRLLLAVALATILALPAFAQTPAAGDVVINEIMYDPPTGAASNEWIEVINRSGATVDLNGLVISDATGSASPITAPLLLEPGEFAVFVRNEADFQTAFPGVPYTLVSGFPSLNNTGDTITLSIGATTLDVVPYAASWGGTDASLERRDPEGPSADAANWTTTTDPQSGTPGEQNTAFEVDTTPPSLDDAEAESALLVLATFSEPLDPATAEDEANYSISDGIGQPALAEVTADPAVVRLTLATPLSGIQTYTLTASGLTDLAGNAMGVETALFAFGTGATPGPRDLVINEFLYDEPTADNPGEFVELFNRTDQTFDLSDFTLNDGTGTDQPITTQQVLLGPGGYAVIVEDGVLFQAIFPDVPFVEQPLWSALNNTGDAIVLKYQGAVVDSLLYSVAWGGVDASLERKDPDGPSSSTSNWATTTDLRGGTPGEINTRFEPDSTPPSLVSAEAESATVVLAAFSEPLDPTTAENTTNYSVSDGLGEPTEAVVTADPAVVRLTLATPIPGLGSYTLTAMGLADLVGNVMGTETASFVFGMGAVPSPQDIVINEFLYDEPTSGSPGEFVEVFNRTDQTFDLSDFTLGEGNSNDAPVSTRQVLLEPGGYAVLVEDGPQFQAVFPGVPFVEPPTWNALLNSGDTIVLSYQGTVIDAVDYEPDWGGQDVSLERKDPRGPSSSASNWATTTDPRGGTPGAINSRFELDETGPQILAVSVGLDETSIVVMFNEPTVPASVSPSAFSLLGTTITGITLIQEDTVVLRLGSRLPTGSYTLTASNLEDPLGNIATSTFAFDFTGDTTPPAIATATATNTRTLRVVFTEPVQVPSAGVSAYTLDGVIPSQVLLRTVGSAPDGTFNAADVLFSPDPPARQPLTLTITGLTDLAGNVRDETSAVVFFGDPDTPSPGTLAITEIMYDPATGGDGEYIEVVNTTADQLFDLAPLVLADALTDDDAIANTPVVVGPGQYLAFVADLATFRTTFPEAPAAEVASFPSLGNGGDLVALITEAGVVIDSVRYDPAWHRVELDDATGVSLERRNAALDGNDPNNWSSSLDPIGGTPGAQNSIRTDIEPPTSGGGLFFSPDPFDAGSGQGTTISYVLDAPAALVRVRIFDGAGRQVRELEAARLSGSMGTLIWDGRDDRGQALRIGPYIVLLEAVDTEGGTTEAYRGVVVLARQL